MFGVQQQEYRPDSDRAVPLPTQLSSSVRDPHDECARRILGVDVSVFSHPQAAAQELEERITQKTPTRVAFFNANLANKSYEDLRFRETLRSFLIFNDGVGVDLASLILYRQSFPYNLNGTDFVPFFLERTRRGLRLAVIGARPEVIQKAARTIESRWPKHRVVALQDGYFTDNEEVALAEKLKEARPDVVLVGMGNPKQEEWLARNIPLVCNLGIGVGALFDFLTDNVPRAPLMIRRARLEWLYRLALEPRRLGNRYTIGIVTFLLRILREATQSSSRV